MFISKQITETRNPAGENPSFAANPPLQGGSSLTFIYFNMSALGLPWQSLENLLPDNFGNCMCLHKTKSGNAVLVFRSSHPHHEHQRLASLEETEVIALMGETTMWGNRLREHLLAMDLKLNELPVLHQTDETDLYRVLTLMAEVTDLRVNMNIPPNGTPTAELRP